MCFTEKKSRGHYEEITIPSRPVAPMMRGDIWEHPRIAPLVPPNAQARKRSEIRVKHTLREAKKVNSNRQDKLFATSDRKTDKIRERALAKAGEDRARASAPRPPPPAAAWPAHQVYEDNRSAFPAPLTIRKRTDGPPPPPPKYEQQPVRRAELGNTLPALKNAARKVDQSHIHPVFRTVRSQIADQGQNRALRTTAWPSAAEVHPALRNVPPTPRGPARPRRVSDLSQSSLERDIHSYLGNLLNHADSPCESKVSAFEVTHKIPYSASSRKRM